LQTWEVLKPLLLDLIDDPVLVARLAQYFAQLGIFDAMVNQRMRWEDSDPRNESMKQRIVQFGPILRHDGASVRKELQRFT
jgi:hypothetical protein